MGKVVAVFITSNKGTPMVPVDCARFVVGKGIEGDRYSVGSGSFSATHALKGIGDHVTLYGHNDVLLINESMGQDVAPFLRRNLIVDLPMRAFVEARFAKIITKDGQVVIEWSNNCAPCTRPGTLAGVDPVLLQQAMWDHGFGGERVTVINVVGSGLVRPGDLIEVVQDGLPGYARRRQ